MFINYNYYFDLTRPIILGNNIVPSYGGTFITTEYQIDEAPRRKRTTQGRKITIKAGWIGVNVTTPPNIKIYKDSIITAGGAVTKDVLPNVIVREAPAEFIIELESEKGINLLAIH